MNKFILIILLVFTRIGLYAQTDIDSLLGIWNDESLLDTVRLNALDRIGSDLCKTYPDSAIDYAVLLKEFAEQSNHKKYKVYIKDIKWIEALGDYVKLVTEENSLLVLSTMKSFEAELPEDRFLRIHKSYIVNLSKIDRFSSSKVEVGDQEMSISRNKKHLLVDALKHLEN